MTGSPDSSTFPLWPPDADETSQSQQEPYPVTDVFQYVELADGRLWMKPEGVTCFAGDLPEQEQKLVWATHYAPAADLFSRNGAWRGLEVEAELVHCG